MSGIGDLLAYAGECAYSVNWYITIESPTEIYLHHLEVYLYVPRFDEVREEGMVTERELGRIVYVGGGGGEEGVEGLTQI